MENLFRQFIFIIFYRKSLIGVVFCAVSVAAIFIAVTLPSIYSSTAKFSLTVPQSFDPLQQESSFDYQNRARRFLQDQKELIMSNRVLAKVAQQLNPGMKEQSVITKQINYIRDNLDVIPPGGETFAGSSVFIIDYTDKSPVMAAQVASAITENYLEVYRQLSQAKTDYSHTFFQEQTEKLQKDMLDKEAKVRDFESKQALALLEILNMGTGKGGNAEVGPSALLTQFSRNYHDLQTELAGLQVSIASLERESNKNGIPAVLPEMEVTGRSITIFKNKVSQLQIQLNEMKPQFAENFEPMKQVEQELNYSVDSLKNELKRTINAQKINAQSIKARIVQLEKTISELQDRVQTIAKQKATYESLLQEFNIAKDAYTKTQAQQEQSRMAQSLSQDKQFLTLIDKPAISVKPIKPNRVMIALGGLLSGIIMGIAVALTVDHFDHRMKTVYDIEKHLNLPVLGSIPSL
ncbi:MAG: hypothetical protein L7F78_01975 [Syntrophales bacterium LBB04]|nr:hypothetical protein [Syntrophales bacterium LBB04]